MAIEGKITSYHSKGDSTFFVAQLNSNEIISEEIQNIVPVFVYSDDDQTEYVVGLGVKNERCGHNQSQTDMCFAFLPPYISLLGAQLREHEILHTNKQVLSDWKFNIDKIYKIFKPLMKLFRLDES